MPVLRPFLCVLLLLTFPPAGPRAEGGLGDWLRRGLGGSGEERAAPAGRETPPPTEVAAGLREALAVGIARAVEILARPGGFLDDPRFRIPLPQPLAGAGEVLRAMGLAALVDDLEVRMNRGAERAVAEARPLFVDAVRRLTFADAVAILRGPPDAATRHLDRTVGAELRRRMRPIVARELAGAGALDLWARLTERLATVPFLGRPRIDLADHVTARASAALFTLLAEEERRIRTDPAARTGELLRRVFGR